MEFTVNYKGVEFRVEGNFTPGETSHDYDLPDTPSEFEVEAIWIEDVGGDIEPMLTEEARDEIERLAKEQADNE